MKKIILALLIVVSANAKPTDCFTNPEKTIYGYGSIQACVDGEIEAKSFRGDLSPMACYHSDADTNPACTDEKRRSKARAEIIGQGRIDRQMKKNRGY